MQLTYSDFFFFTIANLYHQQAFEECKRQIRPDPWAPAPGADQCTWSPSYICKNFQLIRQCGVSV